MARTGRRPGRNDTAEQVLAAARGRFATHGYDGASIRGIAADAGVDPALVHHYFGTKQQLFVAALELPVNPAEVLPQLLAESPETAGVRLAGLFVATWDATAGHNPLLALIRSSVADEQIAELVRTFVTRMVLGPLTASIHGGDAELRAGLVASQLLGLAMGRYVLRLGPLADADAEDVVAAVGPTLQRYLTGAL